MCTAVGTVAYAQKTKVEEVPKVCENISFNEKPVVAVAPFKIAAGEAQVGSGLSDMMMNALLNCGCFRVVERERMNVLAEEQGMGISGGGDESSFAQIGKLIGAQLLVMGTITEFSENESGGGGGGGGIFRRAPIIGGGGIGMRQAHIGYTIRLVNPSTGEILVSQSFDKKRTSVGAAGGGIFGNVLAGGVFYKSKAMQDAVEESLIEATAFIGKKRSEFLSAMPAAGSAAGAGEARADKANCGLLKVANKPKFMVIIPEEHLAGAGSRYDPARQRWEIVLDNKGGSSGNNSSAYSNSNEQNMNKNAGTDAANAVRSMFRPPDPAGETEIMKNLLEFGFDVVDAKQYEKLRSEKQFMDAFDNPKIASQLASKFGADIIIVGEAFSEYAKAANNMVSCRARVEAKAIMASDARILATDGLHGSGMDISEVIAGKTALRNAGTKVANYFLTQLCAKADNISGGMGKKSGAADSQSESEIKIANADFAKASAVLKLLQTMKGVTRAERTAFADKIAVFSITHSGSTDQLVEKLMATKPATLKLDVQSINGNSVMLDAK